MEHTRVINRLFESFEIKDFDRALVRERTDGESVFVYVDGLNATLRAIYDAGRIPEGLL